MIARRQAMTYVSLMIEQEAVIAVPGLDPDASPEVVRAAALAVLDESGGAEWETRYAEQYAWAVFPT